MAGIIAKRRKTKLDQPATLSVRAGSVSDGPGWSVAHASGSDGAARMLPHSGLLSLPNDQEQPRARLAGELLWPVRVRRYAVADRERIALDFVNAQAGLSLVLPGGINEVNLLRLLGGIEQDRALKEYLVAAPSRVVRLVDVEAKLLRDFFGDGPAIV